MTTINNITDDQCRTVSSHIVDRTVECLDKENKTMHGNNNIHLSTIYNI